jgi:CHASE3 domain sensor protein
MLMMEAVMQINELYLQRAAECERMAEENPQERDSLRQIANTWRWLAEAAEEFGEVAEIRPETRH